jgi:carboxylesterase type B
VNVFKGIPYAAPPFGANRFRPPQPADPWSGVRDALSYGAKPLQVPYPPPWDVLIPELDVPGDDCLTLNIWSPELGAAGHPVMAWITGGMFEHGTAAVPSYDGSRFARDGIVCVTINYRVGADGPSARGWDSRRERPSTPPGPESRPSRGTAAIASRVGSTPRPSARRRPTSRADAAEIT